MPMLSLPRSPLAPLAAALVLAVAAGAAPAAQLACSGPRVSLEVDVNPAAGTCAVDGQRAALRKPYNPVVCHISDPQLRILTIATDGAFTWEETDSARVVRGTCEQL